MKRPRFIFFVFVLVFCLLIQLSHAQFPQSITNAMATRHMRYHHYMWHQVRANWNKFSTQTQNQFASIGWRPPNPARTSSDVSITNNYAGEDFLYMHRDMIRLARQAATSNGDSTAMLSSWLTIPAPDDPDYPVPPTYGYYSEYKTYGHYLNMKNEERYLKNYNTLRRMTLNQLGIQIENFIHTSLHYRWSGASSVGYRGGGIVTSNVPYIDKSWDTPSYDWMGDSYASHVNPLFWKLHGWIDDRVEDWRQANGLSSITWHGTWTGGPTSNLGSVVNKEMGDMHEMNSDPEAVGDVLMKAIEILANSGVPEAPLGAKFPTSNRQKRVIKTCKKKKRS